MVVCLFKHATFGMENFRAEILLAEKSIASYEESIVVSLRVFIAFS